MIRFLKALVFFALFASINVIAEDLAEDIDLFDGVSDSYSPYSYKANCSYLFDAGCSGRVYNPSSGTTFYSGNRWNHLRKPNGLRRSEFSSKNSGWKHRRSR